LNPPETQRFKIIVIGDAGVGKTSILSKYIDNDFPKDYVPTIAVDYKSFKPTSTKKNI
jgi:GTPase SAR1 family protein